MQVMVTASLAASCAITHAGTPCHAFPVTGLLKATSSRLPESCRQCAPAGSATFACLLGGLLPCPGRVGPGEGGASGSLCLLTTSSSPTSLTFQEVCDSSGNVDEDLNLRPCLVRNSPLSISSLAQWVLFTVSYRGYCSRRQRRLRKTLNFKMGNRHKFTGKKVTEDLLTDNRY